MTIERMNQLISRLDGEIDEMTRKRNEITKERDLALAAQTQKIFAKHHIPPDQLMKLKYATEDQIKALLAAIVEEPEKKTEKEINDHAEKVTT